MTKRIEETRPKKRAECPERQDDGRRYCPWVGCRHHLCLDVTESGSVVVPGSGKATDNDILKELDARREHCALDVAEQCGRTLNEVGELLGLTRERVRQIEADALGKALMSSSHQYADIIDVPISRVRTLKRELMDSEERRREKARQERLTKKVKSQRPEVKR